jgi:5'-AMP-activated protein kinase regulatory gamma subunit
MLTVLDIIHLIQYYYHNASYDSAVADVEHFRLESLRGALYLHLIF